MDAAITAAANTAHPTNGTAASAVAPTAAAAIHPITTQVAIAPIPPTIPVYAIASLRLFFHACPLDARHNTMA